VTLVVVVPAPTHPAPEGDPGDGTAVAGQSGGGAQPQDSGARRTGWRARVGRGLGVGKTDPAQRVTSSLISSVRAVRGRVPGPEQITVLDLAEAANRPPDGAASAREVSEEAARLATEVLRWWWNAATRIGQVEGQPAEDVTVFDVDSAVRELGASPYFGGSPELPLLEARMLGRYLTDQKFRHEARDRTQSVIGPAARVVVGHGLGALVAYEALCALGDAASVTLVTLSAPMCGSDEVFNRLEPAPRSGQGHWPASVRRWFNIVADSDPTAMAAPQLTDRFGPGIEDEIIEIRSGSGDIYPYLLDRATGRAVAAGLA
jgi:hypothetical protein